MYEILQVDTYDTVETLLNWWSLWFVAIALNWVLRLMIKWIKDIIHSGICEEEFLEVFFIGVFTLFLIWLDGILVFGLIKVTLILWFKFIS